MAATSDNEDQKDDQQDRRERKRRQRQNEKPQGNIKQMDDIGDSKKPARPQSTDRGRTDKGKKLEEKRRPLSAHPTMARGEKLAPSGQQAAPHTHVKPAPPMDANPTVIQSQDHEPEVISFNFVLRNKTRFFKHLPDLADVLRDYDIVYAAAKGNLKRLREGYRRFQNVQKEMSELERLIRESTRAHIEERKDSRVVEWMESHSEWGRVIKLEPKKITLKEIKETDATLSEASKERNVKVMSLLSQLRGVLEIPGVGEIQPDATWTATNSWTATVSWKLKSRTTGDAARGTGGTRQRVTMNEDEGGEAQFAEEGMEMEPVDFNGEEKNTNGLPVRGIVFIKFQSRKRSGKFVDTWGSGWILNNDTVVTSGHCVVNLNKMATSATIHVGYEERDGNQHQAAPVNFRETLRGKHVIVQWAYFSRFLSKYDIALIKTETKFNYGRVLYWQPTPRGENHKIIVAGYPKPDDDQGKRKKKSQGPSQVGTDFIRYRVDTLGGSSGSPVLLQGSHTVIGVHKGVERREENKTTREIDSNNQAVFLNNTEWNNVNQMDKTLCKASERAEHERRSRNSS